MNPPFGGKEGREAQTHFAYKTSATQVLFLQHVIDALKPGGRCWRTRQTRRADAVDPDRRLGGRTHRRRWPVAATIRR